MSKYIDGTSVDLASFSGDDIIVVVEQSGQRDTYATINQLRALLDTLPIVGGTANGVLYLNGSKVATSGSGLTFDGTNLGVGVASAAFALDVGGQDGTNIALRSTGTNAARFRAYVNSAEAGVIGFLNGGGQFFEVAGSEQMRLTSTGLGIGTNNPISKLHVDTANAGYGLTLAASSLTARTYQFGLDSNAYLSLYDSTAAAARLTLDTSGNLGLGVTPSAWETNFTAIELKYGTALWNPYNGAGAALSANVARVSGSLRYIGSGDVATMYTQLAGAHNWFTAPSGNAGDPISFTQAMTLDASGNLLVGTTSAPAYGSKVRVQGGLEIYNSQQLNIDIGNANPYEIVNRSNGGFAFYPTGSVLAAVLTAAGNFSIGSTADRATTVGTRALNIFNGTAPAGTLANGISIYSDAGEAYVMDAAGNATLFSPHDRETNEWIFKSTDTTTGKVLRIDVERLLRFVNDHFGLDAVKEFTA